MDHNLQKREGINLLRKYLHMPIISLFGDLLCTGWRVCGHCYVDTNERKSKFVNIFCIKTVQYILSAQVSSRYHRELGREVVLSHCTNGTCSYVQAGQISCNNWTETSSASSHASTVEGGAKHLCLCPSKYRQGATPRCREAVLWKVRNAEEIDHE